MPREVAEWIGNKPDSRIPDRVKARLFLACEGRCAHCTQKALTGWACDHKVALINGGENRESNLQILCGECHKQKTQGDVAVKSKTYAMAKSYLGLKRSKGRPMPGTKRSGLRKRMNGRVERW